MRFTDFPDEISSRIIYRKLRLIKDYLMYMNAKAHRINCIVIDKIYSNSRKFNSQEFFNLNNFSHNMHGNLFLHIHLPVKQTKLSNVINLFTFDNLHLNLCFETI